MEKTPFQKLETLNEKFAKIVGKVFSTGVLISPVYTHSTYVNYFTVYNWVGTIAQVCMEERWIRPKKGGSKRKVKKYVFVLSADPKYYEEEKELMVALSERVARYITNEKMELM